ncbi:hypothetical protein K402DRAFT_394285 [Aulographum hederae CBS 113979]|uniref:Uncharacterized protein n=1 Tax=Aulographum hederae CBS 113979 TaxID=1176131 RepID=A0A6G1GYK3_9PEZI|nr:hypothetical protein K402DRAFT_394285 [Aulographum hederae CBS 113979]
MPKTLTLNSLALSLSLHHRSLTTCGSKLVTSHALLIGPSDAPSPSKRMRTGVKSQIPVRCRRKEAATGQPRMRAMAGK